MTVIILDQRKFGLEAVDAIKLKDGDTFLVIRGRVRVAPEHGMDAINKDKKKRQRFLKLVETFVGQELSDFSFAIKRVPLEKGGEVWVHLELVTKESLESVLFEQGMAGGLKFELTVEPRGTEGKAITKKDELAIEEVIRSLRSFVLDGFKDIACKGEALAGEPVLSVKVSQ